MRSVNPGRRQRTAVSDRRAGRSPRRRSGDVRVNFGEPPNESIGLVQNEDSVSTSPCKGCGSSHEARPTGWAGTIRNGVVTREGAPYCRLCTVKSHADSLPPVSYTHLEPT